MKGNDREIGKNYRTEVEKLKNKMKHRTSTPFFQSLAQLIDTNLPDYELSRLFDKLNDVDFTSYLVTDNLIRQLSSISLKVAAFVNLYSNLDSLILNSRANHFYNEARRVNPNIQLPTDIDNHTDSELISTNCLIVIKIIEVSSITTTELQTLRNFNYYLLQTCNGVDLRGAILSLKDVALKRRRFTSEDRNFILGLSEVIKSIPASNLLIEG